MNRSRMFVALAVAVTILISARGGQAAETPDLVTNGMVRVESANGALLPDVHVHHEDGQLEVWGMMSSSPLPAHVDVEVFTSDRKLIAETEVVPTLVRRTRPSGVLWRFEAKLPVTLSSEVIVKIAYGFGPHETAQTGEASSTVQK